MERTFLKWIWDERKWMFFVIPTIIVLSFLAAILTNHDSLNFCDLESWWSKWLEMPVVLGTFIFSIFIARRTLLIEWDSSLPKKLTVHFKYNDKYIMTCHEAFLAGEDDIRQWGQQLGKQMNNKVNLNLEPWVDSTKEPRIKKKFNHYVATFFLSEMPSGDHNLQHSYKIWFRDPSSNAPKIQEVIVKHHPDFSFTISNALNYKIIEEQKND